jgi:CRP-like cAMP-binding protein
MTATAVAANDVQLLSAPGKELRELCDREHEVGFCLYRALASALARRLLATRLQMLDVFSRESPRMGSTGENSSQDESGPTS